MFSQYRHDLRRIAVAALVLALILRVAWGILVPVVPMSDCHAYDVFAQNIAQGNGYGWEPNNPTALWPVGTAAIYALIYRLFGHDYTVVVLFQVAVGVAVVALGMSLARRWFGEVAAVMTGWILACWPLLIQYTTILASELFFIFFVLLAFWLASAPGRGQLTAAISSGVALAAASYIRPLALVMAPLLFLRNGNAGRPWLGTAWACIVSVVVTIACILPWSYRNWQVLDRFVLISTNGGENLWMGNNPSGSLEYMNPPKLDIPNEADRDKFLTRRAVEYIVQDPAAFVVRGIRKFVVLHDRETTGVGWNEAGIVKRAGQGVILPLKLISTAYWLVIFGLAVYGIFVFGRTFGLIAVLLCPPVATWAYYTLVHTVTVAGDRYHIPSIPFVAMMAAYALGTLWASRSSVPDFATRRGHG